MLEIILIDEQNRNLFSLETHLKFSSSHLKFSSGFTDSRELSPNRSLASGGTSGIAVHDLLRKAGLLRKTCTTSVPFLPAKIFFVLFENT